MTIVKINADTKFTVGMIICAFRNNGIGGPRKITKVTSAQITAVIGDSTRNIRLNGLSGYLVSSEEEGMTLFNLFYERENECDAEERKAAAEARRRVFAEWAPRFDALLNVP